MKKFMFIALISSLTLMGCSSTTVSSNTKSENTKILWEHSLNLPAQKGMEKNIGTAGVLYGTLENKYVVVGGGANFPYDSVLNGGAKKMYSDIFVLSEANGELIVIDQINLPNEIGYGTSITTEEGIYYLGGGATPEADNDILFLSMKNGKLNVEKIGDLPFTFQNGGAVKYNNKLYIHSGKQDGKATNKMYEYDLATKEIKELPAIPGAETRTQSVTQILNENLYVFSGGDSIAYTDGYKFDFVTEKWTPVSPVQVNGKHISLLGASSVKLNDEEMLVIGGFNKEVYDNAVKNLGTLKGNELEKFRQGYFGADPYEFNWNKEILVYNATTDLWKSLGEVPFDAPCGEGLVLVGNSIYSINGEIKPGVRTNKVFKGIFFNK